jgi:glycine/D-amino acid oxidase-like deaminating enzyme
MPPTPNLPTPPSTRTRRAPASPRAAVSQLLEAETIGSKLIVHNYGYGGAGITLSWGCAAKVADLVKTRAMSSHDTKVTVLGAGVTGMTATFRLLDLNLGLTVMIYAKDVWLVLNNWNFAGFAKGLDVQFARNVDTPATLDGALAAAKVFNGPALIAAQVDAHGLPAELTGAALAGGGPLR